MATLEPPAASALQLSAPEPVAVVEPNDAELMVPIDDSAKQALAKRADEYVASLSDLDFRSPEFMQKVRDVVTMGDEEMRQAAGSANRMLQRPVKALQATKGDNNTHEPQEHVSQALVSLRQTVESLDPAGASISKPRKLLGLIPFGSKVTNYFDKYATAQQHLDGIIRSLKSGQDELRKDNAAIEGEKARLWQMMGKLQEYAVLAKAIDGAAERKAEAMRATNPEAADAMTREVLFAVRQKHTDVLTQLAVCAQGYLALDMIRRNNTELIRGVERATTTTVAALRTAVTVAGALANQKLVLDQISALNTTTSGLIAGTSRMLNEQTTQVHEQAANSTVSLDSLREAFDNIYATMDTIDSFKIDAVANMAQTVSVLETEIGRATTYLERAQRDQA